MSTDLGQFSQIPDCISVICATIRSFVGTLRKFSQKRTYNRGLRGWTRINAFLIRVNPRHPRSKSYWVAAALPRWENLRESVDKIFLLNLLRKRRTGIDLTLGSVFVGRAEMRLDKENEIAFDVLRHYTITIDPHEDGTGTMYLRAVAQPTARAAR